MAGLFRVLYIVVINLPAILAIVQSVFKFLIEAHKRQAKVEAMKEVASAIKVAAKTKDNSQLMDLLEGKKKTS
jgi:hypothetical protein